MQSSFRYKIVLDGNRAWLVVWNLWMVISKLYLVPIYRHQLFIFVDFGILPVTSTSEDQTLLCWWSIDGS